MWETLFLQLKQSLKMKLGNLDFVRPVSRVLRWFHIPRYTFNASFVYVGKGSNPLKAYIIIETFTMSGFYSVPDEIYRNKPYYFISTKSYFNRHELINLDRFLIYWLLLLYPTPKPVCVSSNAVDWENCCCRFCPCCIAVFTNTQSRVHKTRLH